MENQTNSEETTIPNGTQDEMKQRLGTKYIGEGVGLTDNISKRQFKIHAVKNNGFTLIEEVEIGTGAETHLPYEDFLNKFDKSKIDVEGYGHTQEDQILLRQVIRDIMAGHTLAERDSVIAEKENAIGELVTEEVELKQGGVILKAKANKNGKVTEIKNQFGKKIMSIRIGDDVYSYNADKKDYEHKSGSETHLLGKKQFEENKYKVETLKKGGSIKNQYEGLTPEQIWTKWDKEQKIEFLRDHFHLFSDATKVADDFVSASNHTWETLPTDIKEHLRMHTQDGQYAKGGKAKMTEKEIKEHVDRIINHEILSNQDALVRALLEKEILSYDNIENLYVYPEWSKKVVGESLLFPEGSYDERETFLENFDRLKEESEELLSKEEISEATHDRNIELIDEAKEEFESETEETKQQEVYSWYLVTDWLGEKLEQMGEPILKAEDYNAVWWGRTVFGQQIEADGTIQKIVKKFSSMKKGGITYDKGGDTSYNGWKNYETWNVKLWLDNDSGSQSYWDERAREIAKESKKDKYSSKKQNAQYTLSEELKEYHEENNPLADQASTYSDLLGGALREVDWYEIAENLLSEIMKWSGGEMARGGEAESWETGVYGWIEKNKPIGGFPIKNAEQQKDLAEKIGTALNKNKEDWGRIYNWLSGYYDTPFMYSDEDKKYYIRGQMAKGGKAGKGTVKTIKITVYKFDELSKEGKEKALDNLRDINVDHDWREWVYEDAKNIGLKIKAFDLDRNLHAEGDLLYSGEDVANRILKDHGQDTETAKTAKTYLSDLKKIEDKYTGPEDDDERNDDITALEEEFLKSLLEDYATMLQKEYEHKTSDEGVKETIEANEYEFTDDGKISRYKKGGKVFNRSFRYLELKPGKTGLELSLTEEGKEFAKEKKDEGVADVFILPDLFDDVQGNSEYIFHPNMGDSGFGLTDAPGITDGYHHSEDVHGAFDTDFPKTARVFWYPQYENHDMVEDMLEEGKVVLTEAKAKGGYLNQGGKADRTPNYYRFRQASPKGVSECAVPEWATKVAEATKKGAKITTCKKDGKWFIQSILIPKEGVKPGEAKKLRDEIKAKFSRKKKALGGRAETGTNDEIQKTISGLETLRDTTDNAEEKTKYQDLINELN